MAARSPVDVLTIRALSLALNPGARPETSAPTLIGLADGNCLMLRRALHRIQSQRPDRSAVADRAAAAIRAALDACTERGAPRRSGEGLATAAS